MARNDITGDLIASRASNQEKYADGWDAIFGKKDKVYLDYSMECIDPEIMFNSPLYQHSAENTQKLAMALDFHDSTPMKGQLPDGTLYGEVVDVGNFNSNEGE